MKTYDHSPKPRYSPWGAVQTAEELAPGIWSVSTAGHGGIMLSPSREADMPAHLAGARHYGEVACYEEDCEWALVALAYPEAFNTLREWQKEGDKTHYEYAVETVKNFDTYRAAYDAHFATAG